MSTYNLLLIYPHLTDRDRWLLHLLDEHQVLTTDQIHRLAFRAERTCQIRLVELRALDLLDRFRFARADGGSHPWHWVLGLAGTRFQAAVTRRPSPTERSHRERLLRLSASPTLTHLVAVNEFFVRLHHAARTSADTSLDRWWSEAMAARQFLTVHPDGHGLWTTAARTVGFFLECDRGTESLPRLVAKLGRYADLVRRGGPRYPVLFWLPPGGREAHLQHALRRMDLPVPVATATHDTDPAAAGWLPADAWRRVNLTELPSDHGRDHPRNPNWRDGELDLHGRGETNPGAVGEPSG
ncbi:protein involved in plasmid replication-relaxation [Micromonospora kangleipakensis]|uniref:Protein involved in plasmid replication-relaxation n=1 Tax=Micromonospora kangleipakensis TaxID=1077942 RepID=A0A4Q8BDR7_9ACTN|nr:replication-relaxation family protein [Micromonospora kangleipakensis]RZU76040.1 protein involved in plasmid replication-relaxation [Micromonospora kangleipakensis]